MPYDELPIRVNRIAYREFSRDPTLALEDFKKRLGREVFGNEMRAMWVEDLLVLSRVFFDERTWCQPSPLASPRRMRFDIATGRVKPAKFAEYRRTLQRVGEITERHAQADNAGRRQVYRIAKWVGEQWSGEEMKLLDG